MAGVLGFEDEIQFLANRGRPVHCYDTEETRRDSVLGAGLSAFAVPKEPRNAHFHIDEYEPLTGVGLLVKLRDVKLPCIEFLSGATIVADESGLREVLAGRHFRPRANWHNFSAMEIE